MKKNWREHSLLHREINEEKKKNRTKSDLINILKKNINISWSNGSLLNIGLSQLEINELIDCKILVSDKAYRGYLIYRLAKKIANKK